MSAPRSRSGSQTSDAFSGLVNFGSSAGSSNFGQNKLSLDQQRLAKQQQQRSFAMGSSNAPPSANYSNLSSLSSVQGYQGSTPKGPLANPFGALVGLDQPLQANPAPVANPFGTVNRPTMGSNYVSPSPIYFSSPSGFQSIGGTQLGNGSRSASPALTPTFQTKSSTPPLNSAKDPFSSLLFDTLATSGSNPVRAASPLSQQTSSPYGGFNVNSANASSLAALNSISSLNQTRMPAASAPSAANDPFDFDFLEKKSPSLPVQTKTSPVAVSGLFEDDPMAFFATAPQPKPYTPEPVKVQTIPVDRLTAPATSSPNNKKSRVLDDDSSDDDDAYGYSRASDDLDEKVAKIMDMGFDIASAKSALEATGNNVDEAIDLLVQNSEALKANNRRPPVPPRDRNDEYAKEPRRTRFRDNEDDDGPPFPPGQPSPRGRQDEGSVERRYERSGEANQSDILGTASAIGTSVFNNAKSMFNYSKKKISEVVEKAQEAAKDDSTAQPSFVRTAGAVVSGVASVASRAVAGAKDKVRKPRVEEREREWREGHRGFRDDDYESYESKGYEEYKGFSDTEGESKYRDIIIKGDLSRYDDDSSDDDNSTGERGRSNQFGSTPPSRVAPATPPPPPKRPEVPVIPEQLERASNYHAQGNALFKQGQYGDADLLYGNAVQALPSAHILQITLHSNRAACRLKTGAYGDAVSDTTTAIDLCGDYQECRKDKIKALLRRANAYDGQEKWDVALKDFRSAMILDPSSKVAQTGVQRCTKATRVDLNAVPVPSVVVPPVATNNSNDLFMQFQGITVSSAPALSAPVSRAKGAEEAYVKKAVDTAVQRLREQNLQAEQEDAMKLALKDQVDDKILRWKSGKEENLRALLSSLHTVVWPELEWKTINLSEILQPQQVKVKYMRAVAKLHPDKLSNITVEQKLIANSVFAVLNKAWDAFKVQNGM
ncbi:hypothetical protein BJ742DRAFT_811963 [Cladochytrium replicatum]|nr:hypothetical protein BJ742DRAFT_811963 [Cladochytrium replicatum]